MTTDLPDVGDGWCIWRHGSDWSTDFDSIEFFEYLDDHGFYCVSVTEHDARPDGDDTWAYDAIVQDVQSEDQPPGTLAYLVHPI